MSNKEERMNRNKSIIEDYKNGKPILEIARDYNLSETMCYKILKGTQEPPRYFEKKRKRLTTRNEQIVKQYKGGMTARELGKMYGISMQRIYAILHSSGEYESQKYNHIETALKKEKKIQNVLNNKCVYVSTEKSCYQPLSDKNMVRYAASMKDYSSVSLGAKGRNQFVTNDELVGKIIDMLR